jgi:hypothetical protein
VRRLRGVLRLHTVGPLALPATEEGEDQVGREVRAAEHLSREVLPPVGASERVVPQVGDDSH